MILNKKWEKVTLEKTKDTGIIYLDAKELKSPEGRSLNLPYNISEKSLHGVEGSKRQDLSG